jgi:capsular polysaccharide biosynthesis protein
VNSNGIVRISYRGNNPRECAEIANTFARVFVEMNGKNAKNREKQIVKITERAKEPAFPYYPDRRKIMIVGVILGFFAGIGIAIYFEENGIDEKINERVQRNSELPPSHIINFHNKYLNAIALIITAILVLAVIMAVPLFLINRR